MRALNTLTLAAGLFAFAGQASAEYLIKSYASDKKTEGFKSYMVGFSRGLIYADIALDRKKQPLLFCPPHDIPFDQDLLLNTLDEYIVSSDPPKEAPVELFVLKAFQAKWPCTES